MTLSLALSVKMNILLVAPAFGLLLLLNTGLLQTARYGILIVALQVRLYYTPLTHCIYTNRRATSFVQALLGAPFLIQDWRAYIGRAFEFSRVFIHYWSVNWQFLPEKVFLSKTLAKVLLAGHAVTLIVAAFLWCQPSGGLSATLQRAVRYPARPAALGKLPSPSCKWGSILMRIFGNPCKPLTISANIRHDHSALQLQSHWNTVRKVSSLSILCLGSASTGILALADALAPSSKVRSRIQGLRSYLPNL